MSASTKTKEAVQAMKKERKLRETVREVSMGLVLLERRLYDVGLIKTAHQLNGVTKTLGWETAEILERTTGKKAGHPFQIPAKGNLYACRECGMGEEENIHLRIYTCRYCRGEGLSPCTCEYGTEKEED